MGLPSVALSVLGVMVERSAVLPSLGGSSGGWASQGRMAGRSPRTLLVPWALCRLFSGSQEKGL